MEKNIELLLDELESDNCNYSLCRELIMKIGGPTSVVIAKHNFLTTPLREVIERGHYDFAIELLEKPNLDLDVSTIDIAPIIWDLQYLWEQDKEKRYAESDAKLKILRTMIEKGANPNPIVDNDELLWHIRYEINNGSSSDAYHLVAMEHIIDERINAITDYFFSKVQHCSIKSIFASKYNLWFVDERQCFCDHIILVFEDGEKFLLSSYQKEDDEWDFYAVKSHIDAQSLVERHSEIPTNENQFPFLEKMDEDALHYIKLGIDDAVLLIHADDTFDLTLGIISKVEGDWDQIKRKNIF